MVTMNNSETYTYRHNPLYERSFLIFKADSPVGDYTILDEAEDRSLAEKKMMNLIRRLNGERDLLPLGEFTKSRLLFHCKPKMDQSDPTEVVFYTYDGKGVSKENAILTIQGDIQ
jgi:hypothetical protein